MPRLLRALCAASAAVVVLPETVLAQATVLPPVTVQGGRQVQPARRPAPATAATESAVEATVDPNLPPVENTTAGPVQGYRALTAVSAVSGRSVARSHLCRGSPAYCRICTRAAFQCRDAGTRTR